jgi:hypothetical protein
MTSMRPASDSDACCSSSGAALPSTKKRALRPSVGEHPQHRKQVEPALDLVDHHPVGKLAEAGHRLCEPLQAPRIFEIEVEERIRRDELAGP